jgi:radical SAM protein with 4Fe4S-binding SPASM domain
MRRVWGAKPCDLGLDLYEKIAQSSFPKLSRLILYGLGEPLVNPHFLEMPKISRGYLPKGSQIIISTNGSLLSRDMAAEMLQKAGVDSVSFSIDTTDLVKLGHIRVGSKPGIIMENLQYVARIKNNARRPFKLVVEAIVMEENFKDLPQLVKNLGEAGVDRILVSHIVPYTGDVFRRSVYTTLSKPSFALTESSLKHGWALINEACYELWSPMYGVNTELKAAKIIQELWEKADENGYWINLPSLFNSTSKIELIGQIEECFQESKKIANEYQVDLRLPTVCPDAKKRSCPYVDENVAVVRSDGKVVPCLEFAYSHPMYVNGHVKDVREVILGDLRREKLEDIWNKESYLTFRETRRNFAKNIPWCGDCSYSTNGGCYFTETNESDCRGNEPGCSECIYSVGLAQCNI